MTSLGYLYQAPLLYGSPTIPVSILAGIAFLFLGTEIWAAAGRDCWPTRTLTGDSVKARLLRAFLPASALTLVISLVLDDALGGIYAAPFVASMTLLGWLVVVIIGIGRLSSRIGAGIDQGIAERARLDKALQESEDKYHAMVDNSPNMIGIFQDGMLKYVNATAIQELGWKYEELVSSSFDPMENIVSPQSRSLLKENVGRRLRGEDISPYEISLTRKDGSQILVSVKGTMLTYEGKPAIQFSFRDMTKREHAYETKSSLAAIVESSDDAIIGKTLDGVITSWNKGAENLYGYSAEETKGKSVSILIPPSLTDELPKIFERIKRGERIEHFETERMKKDGTVIQVSLAVSPIRDSTGRIVGASTMARDITGRKRLEEELKQHSLHLEELVAERTKELGSARERLEYAVESNPAVLCIGKPLPDQSDFNTTYLSKNIKALTGFEADELIGFKGAEFWKTRIPPNHYQKFLAEIPLLWRNGQHTFEYQFLHKDGAYRWIREEERVIRNAKGEVQDVIGYWTDVTENKMIEEQYRELFEASPVSLWEDDFSEVKQFLDELRKSGVSDFDAYFANHPKDFAKCASLMRVVNVNKATLDLTGAKSKDEIIGGERKHRNLLRRSGAGICGGYRCVGSRQDAV